MALSRRTILQGAGALSLLAGRLAVPGLAQAALVQSALAQPAPAGDIPPILFVHGNGDHAALWLTTLWRMESNGVPRERMAAINFTNPLARTDDKVEQAGRSSTEDQRRELAEAVRELKQKSGAARIALVGNSRGGNAIRNTIRNGGGGDISHAVLCGTPNHGVYASDDGLGNEFNGRGPFLRGLNDGDSEVTAGTAFLTLRSDGLDKYAQADGRFIGKPGTPTNVTAEGPALKGATNLVLGAVDHRETAYHPRAFREIYKFIAGHEPSRIEIVPETAVRLSGLVTGTPGGVPTNQPVPGATVDIHRVSAETGERLSGPLHSSQTGADGRWGPAQVDPSWPLEFVLTSPDAVTTHIYRSPFPRSSEIVHLRAARPLLPADAGAGAIVLMSRPRGYFGLPRDIVLFDGKEPADVKSGVPTDAVTTLRLAAADVGRPVAAIFNGERIVARAWPASENRIAVAELTY
ncbi:MULTISPECIES: hydrolase [unclassified Bradyrhizobium]|uniref:hydrolase n=1 Tax=unclassified Bradyrhizobium TaxID=2631580 RepID=UPI001BAB0F93|nr:MULTISPECIES: hydrolase [unclassified Bradyrhizobium]MBR1207655.1 hydrolase [Bradyrhizobium sp. AUGA SZCCT0124]MBR1317022.1 hydrolase [Bradyrhizobium sp. AUGA SZCCT0051]MBR1345498.1 hydrolase [Bradyrhizobium sp. AUGA SZCCT0105]MBR1360150.1 hydrolase [Bradyrhizobium sp. AUGA SZCCT0045]